MTPGKPANASRGTSTQAAIEPFQRASLKLSVDLKERSYLRCASYLLDARKVLKRTVEEWEQAHGQNATTEEIRALLAELEQ